jgi:predicted transcriptional regulator
MKKALLISIPPEWAEKILNGKKTIEIRTWIPKDYVGWVYVAITKDNYKNHLYKKDGVWTLTDKHIYHYPYKNICGKVAFRFWYEKVEKVIMRPIWGEWEAYGEETDFINLSKKSCLTQKEIMRYLKGKVGYAWHIDKLEIFDRPKELSEFYKGYDTIFGRFGWLCLTNPLTKAPQKCVWVYTKE